MPLSLELEGSLRAGQVRIWAGREISIDAGAWRRRANLSSFRYYQIVKHG